MASYVPPHKRHINGLDMPTPTGAFYLPQFRKNRNHGSSRPSTYKGNAIVYADRAISRWFALGVDDDTKIPPYVHLKPVSEELFPRVTGERPLALVNNQADEHKEAQDLQCSPWEYIAVNVWRDLQSLYGTVRSEIESNKLEEVRPTLVARIGNVLFRQDHFRRLETFESRVLSESTLGQLKRSFYTNLPLWYVENIVDFVVPKVGVHFEAEKDVYHIKLSLATRPNAIISCKCHVNKDDGRLKLYKIELNQVRQLVVDISCIHKDLDLRLMLCEKKIVKNLTNDEENGVRCLVNSALVDPNVMGGLRWPLGKASTQNKFTVVGVWHTISRTYSSSVMKLKVRQADRYNFINETGESSREVILKLKEVARELKENKIGVDSVSNGLKDTLKVIWENFLDCSRFIY